MTRPDEIPGPTIWASREVRRDVPTEGKVFWRVAVVISLTLFALVVLAGWALS